MKTALVTGGSRGIGAGIALALADAGFQVAINYNRGVDPAVALQKTIVAQGKMAKTFQADVSKYDDIQRLFDEVEKEFGPVDVLVNNAGLEIRHPSTEYDEATWDIIMNTNLKGAFFCSQRALRTMKDRGWGRIINISSVHETRPTGNRSIYSISKSGMLMMTREHAREFGAFGITVNSIAPGAIRTDLNRKVLEDPAYEAMVLKNIPANYIGVPEDIGGTVVFLTSDAARYVNGAAIYIDGGLSLC
ncbi:MAG: 3-oxoacyl-ACP reductase family protein [Planctomycetia bacterium]|nr:3-oxoacyl-ACP reductase family protein [Planctomycetia bacterium]